jgi:hypothetical protein
MPAVTPRCIRQLHHGRMPRSPPHRCSYRDRCGRLVPLAHRRHRFLKNRLSRRRNASACVSFGFRPPIAAFPCKTDRGASIICGPHRIPQSSRAAVEQAFAVGGGLPILPYWNVRSVLPQLHLNLGADPPLLIQTGGVQPRRAQGFDARARRPAIPGREPSARIAGLPKGLVVGSIGRSM